MLSVKAPLHTPPPGTTSLDELGGLFVAALTEDSDTAWHILLDHLSSLPGGDLRKLISQHPDIQHYVHRAVQHALKYQGKLQHLQIVEKLASLLPKGAVEQYQTEELLRSYSYSDIDISANRTAAAVSSSHDKTAHTGLKKKKKRAASFDSSAHKDLFVYSRDLMPATFRAPQLMLTDLVPAANVVSSEIGNAEKGAKSLFSPLQSTITPARHPSKSLHVIEQRTAGTVTEKPFLVPIFSSELEQKRRESHAASISSPTKTKVRSRTERLSITSPDHERKSTTGPLRSAYDVVEAFASGKLQSESESIYVNYANSSPAWNPYDLTVVSKTHVDPEHFVISKFGILHVYPDGESTLQNFADWLQEASLFTMLKQIPFFRFYLMKRAFSRWYHNVRYNQFARIQLQISQRSLRFFPNFQEGVLKIRKLSEELLTVPFHLLIPLGEYSQETYQHSLEGSQVRAQKFLQRYFKYCRRIVRDVLETTQSRALELETEKRHQPFVSELPLSIQKERHMKLERDLKVATYRANRLGDFVTLVEHLVFSCLQDVARKNAQAWVDTSLRQTGQGGATERMHTPSRVSRSLVDHSTSGNLATPAIDAGSEAGESEGDAGSHSQLVGSGGGGGLKPHSRQERRRGLALLCAELQFEETGTLTTSPSMEDLEAALLDPLHNITTIITSTVHPLTDAGGPPTSPSVTHPTRGGVVSPGMETTFTSRPSTKMSTFVKMEPSLPHPVGTEPQLFLLPHQQKPKSLLRALKGITAATTCSVSPRGGGSRDPGIPMNERREQVSRSLGGFGVQLSPGKSVMEDEKEEEEGEGDGVRRGVISVLDRKKFAHWIDHDGVLSATLVAMESAVSAMREELVAICSRYSWLGGVWQFLQQWEGRGRATQLSAEEFESTLTQLHQWVGRISLLPSNLSTSHSLVSVGNGEVVAAVLPRLMAILEQLKGMGVEHTRRVCERVLQETKDRSEALSSKRYDLEGFAEYARQLRECQAFRAREGSSINYVLKVHSTLGKQGVEVPAQDKALGQELHLLWGDFEGRLVEAETFVSTQTPVKAQGLQESIVSCEEELHSLISQVNEAEFIEPTSPPSRLLEELKVIQEEVFVVRARLLGLSKWKEAITGKPHDLSAITRLLDMLFVRQELWKYRRAFDGYEREWTKTPFKKLDISLISEKVSNWLVVCCKLEKILPAMDPVLEGWRERLTELQREIPLLQQLSSKALRTSHWFTIFAALGEDYVPSHPYTLTDFTLYNIYEHSDIILEICHGAMQEDKLQAQVCEMQDSLDAMTISVIQIPLEHYPFAVSSTQQSSTDVGARKPGDKTTTFAIAGVPVEAPRSTLSTLYSLGNDTDLLLSLESSAIQLKVLLSSPHLGSLRGRVEGLLATVRQLLELVSLLVECQDKWQNLLHLFSSVVEAATRHPGLETFQQATGRFQEVTQSIHGDPRLLSLLGKRRGQKGLREMQGEQLRKSLRTILSMLDLVLQKVHSQLEEACNECPRLGYLMDNDILKVSSHSGNPVPIIPLISRVLPAVHSMRFTEASADSTHFAPDTDEGLQLVAIEGLYGEPLPLAVPLPLGRRPAPQWLHALEGALSYSLACRLTECLATFPEELMGTNPGDQDGTVRQWVCSHPAQCVLLSLELKWSSALFSASASSDPQTQLKQVSSRLHTAVDTVAELLRSYSSLDLKSELKYSKTLLMTLQNVIIALRHKMDIVRSLLHSEAFSPDSFVWKNHILYSIEGDVEQTTNDHDFTKHPSTRSSTPYTLGSNMASPRTSCSSLEQQSLAPSQKLQASASNLVASSRSLLNSRHTLLGNEPSRAGTSSSLAPTHISATRPTKCVVQCSDSVLPYGYEPSACDSKLVLTPVTEACLVSLVMAIRGHTVPCISGKAAVGKSETAKEVAKILGQHCYQFRCFPHTTLSTLHRLLACSLSVGSVLLLDGYLSLPPAVMVGLGVGLQTLQLALVKSFGRQPSPSHVSEQSEVTLPTTASHMTISPSPHPTHTPHPHPSTSQEYTPSALPSRASTRIDWYQPSEGWSVRRGEVVGVEFLGHSLTASSAFGCVLVDQVRAQNTATIPEHLKAALRPVHLVSPSMACVAEVLLLSCGFSDSHALGRGLNSLMEHLESQLSSNSKGCHFGLHELKEITSCAACYLRENYYSATDSSEQDSTETTSLEHAAVAHSVMQLYKRRVLPVDSNKLQDLVESYFPSARNASRRSVSPPNREDTTAVLVEAVQLELSDRHLQCLPTLVEKVTELHSGLQHHCCAILTGPSGSGKTACLRTLAAAYHHIGELHALGKHIPGGVNEVARYPRRVDMVVINSAAYTGDELFGSYTANAGTIQWQDGILTRLLRQTETTDNLKQSLNHPDGSSVLQSSQESPHCLQSVCHWVVLDGPLAPPLVDALAALASGEGVCLSSGEKLTLPDSCKLLVETDTLPHLSPSLLSHCALVHCDNSVMTSDAIVDTWLDRAPVQHNLSAMSTETLATMIKQLLPDTLEYLHNLNTEHLGALYTSHLQSRVSDIAETRCFLNFLSAVLERNSPKVDSSLTYTGTSRSSRVSSQMTESRASSVMLHSFSASSVQVFGTPRTGSYQASRVEVHADGDALDPLNDDAISECSDLEAEIGLSMQLQMAAILAFSFIWSIGAFVPFSKLTSYDEFARDQILQLPFAIPLSEEGSVFDYYLDLRSYQFLPWSERRQEGKSTSGVGGYIALPELERYAYILDLYMSYGLNVMLVGEQGTGKTSLVECLIQSRTPVTRLPITYTLTPSQLQHTILNKVYQLEKRAGHQRLRTSRKTVSSPKCVFYLDDLHLASRSCSTPPARRGGSDAACVCTSSDSGVLETIRYAISQDSLTDTTRNYQHDLHNVRYIASCVPSGLREMSPRLSSVFNPVPFLPPSEDCLKQIFSQSVLFWLQQFPETAVRDPELLAEAIAAASVTVFKSVSGRFHPTPSRPHFLFTLHDLMHTYEGLLLLSPSTKAQAQPQFSLLNRRGFLSSTQSGKSSSSHKTKLKTKSGKRSSLPSLRGGGLRRKAHDGSPSDADQAEMTSTLRMLIRLWCHESTRVYADRLLDSKDRMWFLKLLEVCMKYCFCGIDLQGSPPLNVLALGGHTAGPGGRRVRGGRIRGANLPAARSEGPTLADLSSSGIKVETLQRLAPLDAEGDGGKGTLRQLIAYDQLTVRGEDLTGLMFVRFPSSSESGGTENSSETSVEGGEGGEEGTPMTQESGTYSELGDGQVMEILQKHLTQWKSQEEREGGGKAAASLVLFRGAIEHATRLSRVMHLPGSHALLLGPKGTGRKSLVRLVAHIVEAQLFELDEQGPSLHSQLREVCISSAVEGRNTVLLVSSSGHQQWESVCQMMNEGLCPGLFSSSELLVMSSKLQRGKVKKTAEGAQQAFARAVRKNLHVFIIWNTDGKHGNPFYVSENDFHFHSNSSLLQSNQTLQNQLIAESSTRAVFQALYQACSHVDHYHSWSKQAYSEIALSWWQGTGDPKWQEWVETDSQLEAVATLAAHVHLTTVELLQKSLPHLTTTLVTPQTFVECLRTTQSIAVTLKAKEKVTADRLQGALKRLEAVDQTVDELGQELGALQMRLAAAEREVRQRMGLITAAKERYMAASRRCKFAEDTIETETRNVEQLTKVVEEKFSEVSPKYHSALEALSSVQKNNVLEVMGYRDPPSSLTPVFDALCMLFDRPQTWEDCKQLLLSHNFFESLRFFDRDNVPKHKLQKLERLIAKKSELTSVEHGSQAVVPICLWVQALVDYHQAKMVVQPYRERLAEAERTLLDARKTFVVMRKDMMETKSDLEATVKLHRESVQKTRVVEAEIEGVQVKLERASNLLSTMSAQRRKWDEKLRAIWCRIDSVPGHAMLSAASICYLPRIDPDKHHDLLSNWLAYCFGRVGLGSLSVPGHQPGLQASEHHGLSSQQQVVRIQKDFSVRDVLSTEEERMLWQQQSVFPDQITMDRCLAARACCRHDSSSSWPLIFDPNGQFQQYFIALEGRDVEKEAPSRTAFTRNEKNGFKSPAELTALSTKCEDSKVHFLVRLNASDPELCSEIKEAMRVGTSVMLTLGDCQHHGNNGTLLQQIVKRNYTKDHSGQLQFGLDSGTVSVHPDFKLYVVVTQSLESVLRKSHSPTLPSFLCELSSVYPIHLGLSKEGLQSYLQKYIVNCECPEYSIRYRSILTDLCLHQQQMEDSEEQLLRCTLDANTSLLCNDFLLPTVRDCESAGSAAANQIRETKKILRSFDQQIELYKPLAKYATAIFNMIQTLSYTLKYFSFSLDQFRVLLSGLIARYKENKVFGSVSAINAHVLHLKCQLLVQVHRTLCVSWFERHQTLLPFLIALDNLLAQGKLSVQEFQFLGREIAPVEAQLDVQLQSKKAESAVVHDQKPEWITDEEWCGVLLLQKQVPMFRKLTTEVTSNSSEWKEYFEHHPSLMTLVPGMGESVSLGQKLLLWRTFRPEKFQEVSREFVLLSLGPGFSDTLPSSVDTIISLTTPTTNTIVCMLPPGDDGDDTSDNGAVAVGMVEAAAVERGRQLFHHVSVAVNMAEDEEAKWRNMLTCQLPCLASEGGWMVVEHLYLAGNWNQKLESLLQAVGSLSTDVVNQGFRLWVLLPVDVCIGATFSSSCLRVVLEGSKRNGSTADTRNSLQLLQDIQHVVKTTPTLHQHTTTSSPLHWESHEGMISKLQHFLPAPFAEEELSDLSSPDSHRHSHSVLALLYEELCRHNTALVSIHASLQILLGYIRGGGQFSAGIGQMLTTISHNVLPKEWISTFGLQLQPFSCAHTKLVPALTLLKYRVEKFYSSALQSGVLPSTIHPLWFSNPADLLSRMQQSFAWEYQLKGEDVLLETRLVSSPEATDPQPSTIFHGLALHGALWSAQTCCLEPLPPPAATAELSPSLNYVCVAPIGREQLNMKDLSWNVIRCPVFVASAEGSVASLHFTLPMWMSKDLEACTTLPEGQSGIYFQCTLPL